MAEQRIEERNIIIEGTELLGDLYDGTSYFRSRSDSNTFCKISYGKKGFDLMIFKPGTDMKSHELYWSLFERMIPFFGAAEDLPTDVGVTMGTRFLYPYSSVSHERGVLKPEGSQGIYPIDFLGFERFLVNPFLRLVLAAAGNLPLDANNPKAYIPRVNKAYDDFINSGRSQHFKKRLCREKRNLNNVVNSGISLTFFDPSIEVVEKFANYLLAKGPCPTLSYKEKPVCPELDPVSF